ncbi:MAG: cyclic nucleotide-binding domain-containing protein, partial [Roseitalea porphyridii]
MIAIMLPQIRSPFDDARTVSLEKAQALFRVGDTVRTIHLTVSGQLALVRNTAAGTSLILHRAGPEQILAEASVYAPTYQCDGITIEPSTVRALSVAVFRVSTAEGFPARWRSKSRPVGMWLAPWHARSPYSLRVLRRLGPLGTKRG